jgi:hypothetical protein
MALSRGRANSRDYHGFRAASGFFGLVWEKPHKTVGKGLLIFGAGSQVSVILSLHDSQN